MTTIVLMIVFVAAVVIVIFTWYSSNSISMFDCFIIIFHIIS